VNYNAAFEVLGAVVREAGNGARVRAIGQDARLAAANGGGKTFQKIPRPFCADRILSRHTGAFPATELSGAAYYLKLRAVCSNGLTLSSLNFSPITFNTFPSFSNLPFTTTKVANFTTSLFLSTK
jgi:hypothetical protein